MSAVATAVPRLARPRRRVSKPQSTQLSLALTSALLLPFLVLCALILVYPIGQLLILGFFSPDLTLENYEKLAASPLYLRVFLRTLWISTLVTVSTVVLGFPVAYLMSRVKGGLAALVSACVLLPFWSSVLVRTAAWIVLLRRDGLINNLLEGVGLTSVPLQLLYNEFSVVLTMTHVLLPFMILPIYNALRTIPADYARAASMMGASGWQILRQIILPLSSVGIASGSIMVFLTAMGYFVTPTLVGSPREMMIATLISQQIRELLNWPMGATLVTALLVIVLGIAVIFSKIVNFNAMLGAKNA